MEIVELPMILFGVIVVLLIFNFSDNTKEYYRLNLLLLSDVLNKLDQETIDKYNYEGISVEEYINRFGYFEYVKLGTRKISVQDNLLSNKSYLELQSGYAQAKKQKNVIYIVCGLLSLLLLIGGVMYG